MRQHISKVGLTVHLLPRFLSIMMQINNRYISHLIMKELVFLLLFLSECYAGVVFVVELCRHGSRSPLALYPWDDDGRWANGLGELTPVGMRQHFLLGSELRYRYIEQEPVLDDTYLASDVYFRSTDYNRTIMSGQSQIMGLYPAPTGPLLPNILIYVAEPPITVENVDNIILELDGNALPNQFQVFPIHAFPEVDDLELLPDSACARLVENINSVEQSEAYNQAIYSNPEVLSILQDELQDADVPDDLANILDNIICNAFVGNSLPLSFTPEFLSNVTQVKNSLFALPYLSDENARLFSSWFFLDLLQHFEAILEGTEPTHFRLYSAHDTTVAGMLAGMQVYDQKQPPFASSLIYEVSEEDTEFFIRVLYNDNVLIIPTCNNTTCPLSVFMTYLRLRAFPNSTEVCSLSSSVFWKDMTKALNGSEESPILNNGSGRLKWAAWFAIGIVAIVLLASFGACALGLMKKAEEAALLGVLDKRGC